MAEIGPAEKGEDTTAWSENACAALIKLSDSVGNVENLTVYIHEIEDNDTHKVILYNRWSRGEFCVNSRLIAQGHAVSLNFDSSVLKKLNKRKPTKVKAMKLNKRNVCINYLEIIITHCVCLLFYQYPYLNYKFFIGSKLLFLQNNVLSPNNDFSAFIMRQQVNEDQNHSWKQTSKKNSDVPGVEMIIHKFVSPDEIILKYTDHNIVK